jgi:F-type H+-transporting ATPase subunit delta
MAQRGSIARRYARALFAIGVDQGDFEALGEQLRTLAAAYSESAELRQTLANPMFTKTVRRSVLESLLPLWAPSERVRSFALLLFEKQRFSELPFIARAYGEMVDERLGRVRAVVKTAQPLGARTLGDIQRGLERRIGKTVILTTEIVPELIGGVVAQVGDLVLDGSVRTRLGAMRKQLLN